MVKENLEFSSRFQKLLTSPKRGGGESAQGSARLCLRLLSRRGISLNGLEQLRCASGRELRLDDIATATRQ